MGDDNQMSGSEMRQRISWGVGIALGMGIGVATGSALDNMAVGVGIGIAVGVVFAIIIGRVGRRRPNGTDAGAEPDEPDSAG